MKYEEILFAADGEIGFLTLNNPKKINALSRLMIQEIISVLHHVATDESLKVLILRAAGSNFCAGHKLDEMVDGGMKEYKDIFDQCARMMQLLHEIPQPVIAQVQGIATAAGCQLAAWCDLVVAEEGARFATPGVQIGLFCTTPMVAVTRAIGRKAAMEMLMTGRYVSAAEAKELGLVNTVVPLAELENSTVDLARRIAAASWLTLGIGKQAFYAQIDQTDDKALHYAKHTIALNNLADDAQNGIKAFLHKTPVQWHNR
ncbi:MAG: enoyl-CoA hydratase/isomerase family protein [Deltaproteobacteria bacterium]|nr:enoyl-CoA hydratase/isomerase family protein [Candidatus Anaeroferrophillus wilburensis]MBN2889690.1 enoyl-CoA hydratase/isomerase family protein [Deltaproteobacteria bacterium]